MRGAGRADKHDENHEPPKQAETKDVGEAKKIAMMMREEEARTKFFEHKAGTMPSHESTHMGFACGLRDLTDLDSSRTLRMVLDLFCSLLAAFHSSVFSGCWTGLWFPSPCLNKEVIFAKKTKTKKQLDADMALNSYEGLEKYLDHHAYLAGIVKKQLADLKTTQDDHELTKKRLESTEKERGSKKDELQGSEGTTNRLEQELRETRNVNEESEKSQAKFRKDVEKTTATYKVSMEKFKQTTKFCEQQKSLLNTKTRENTNLQAKIRELESSIADQDRQTQGVGGNSVNIREVLSKNSKLNQQLAEKDRDVAQTLRVERLAHQKALGEEEKVREALQTSRSEDKQKIKNLGREVHDQKLLLLSRGSTCARDSAEAQKLKEEYKKAQSELKAKESRIQRLKKELEDQQAAQQVMTQDIEKLCRDLTEERKSADILRAGNVKSESDDERSRKKPRNR